MNISGFIEKVEGIVERHQIEEGQYARYLWQDKKESRKMGVNEYGCADAANILYTIGHFPKEPQKREKWINTLQKMQNPQTGLYFEGTHHTIHTTAHCIAALELFDASPLYPLTELLKYMDYEELAAFLEGLDWGNNPWNNSHQGEGLAAAFMITRTADMKWRKKYFEWLNQNNDRDTGLGVTGHPGAAPLSHQLFGWFHYLFNYENARESFPNPERLIDSCIDMYQNGGLPDTFGKSVGFMEIDWVFAMNRASRQTAYRFDEIKMLLWDFAQKYIPWLDSLDEKKDEGLNDLHLLFGAMCALVELQIALPGKIDCEVPLKNVLDRRPFI